MLSLATVRGMSVVAQRDNILACFLVHDDGRSKSEGLAAGGIEQQAV